VVFDVFSLSSRKNEQKSREKNTKKHKTAQKQHKSPKKNITKSQTVVKKTHRPKMSKERKKVPPLRAMKNDGRAEAASHHSFTTPQIHSTTLKAPPKPQKRRLLGARGIREARTPTTAINSAHHQVMQQHSNQPTKPKPSKTHGLGASGFRRP